MDRGFESNNFNIIFTDDQYRVLEFLAITTAIFKISMSLFNYLISVFYFTN